MSRPLSIPEARALAIADFKRMSQSGEVTCQLIGTIACTLMGAMEGERIQMSNQMFNLQCRVMELEEAVKRIKVD